MIDSISALASGVPMETRSHRILGYYGNQQGQNENRPIVIIFNKLKMLSILYNLVIHFCDYPVQVHPHFFFFPLAGMFVFFLIDV